MNLPDPYKTLQVDPEAEDEVIEAAYRRLARKYHPDVAPGPDALDRMVRINQAWEVLRDPVKRAAVDRARTRSAGAAAQVTAADARAAAQAASRAARERAPAREPQPPAWAERPPESASDSVPPSWGFPGMYDPGPGDFQARPQFVSPNWTSGRSQAGHSYDPGTMRTPQGEGSAGPPPGNPYGSVLNFGRYAGWSLGEIARSDVGYLEWLDRMPIGRTYQAEIDRILRAGHRRATAPAPDSGQRGLFRRR